MRNVLVTGGAGFIGSNLTLALQEKFPEARIVVVDDFRSGDFRNLTGFRGDVVAAGDVLAEVHARDEESARVAAGAVQSSYAIGAELPHAHGILLDVVS